MTLLRTLCLTLFLSIAGASSAHAAVADGLFPIYDASDGVTVITPPPGGGGMRIHFGPKAARLYKTIAGRHADVGCGGDGHFGSDPDALIPRRRGSVRMWTDGDFCAISTKKGKTDGRCLPPGSRSHLCVRVIVVVTDAGRAYLDAKARTYELGTVLSLLAFVGPERTQKTLGADLVALPAPDASPPAGKVGYWVDGENVAVVVLLADGTRRFVRFQDGIYSTNDMQLSFFGDFDFTLL